MLRPDTARAILDEVLADRRLLTHPFYTRWEAGELSAPELAAYAGQYRHFEQALPEVLEAVASSLEHGPARRLVEANLADERGVPAPHLELFDDFARAMGAEVHAVPTPATNALVSMYRDAAAAPVSALAAIAAYEVQSPAIATSKAEGLRTRYGVSEAGTRFWDVHGTMDEAHASWAVEALVAMGASPEQVRESARAAADAWWAFLDERQEAAPALVAG
ncbi:MAG: iron-containing redox enzyme family protein [Acidimicrobiales bacterium]